MVRMVNGWIFLDFECIDPVSASMEIQFPEPYKCWDPWINKSTGWNTHLSKCNCSCALVVFRGFSEVQGGNMRLPWPSEYLLKTKNPVTFKRSLFSPPLPQKTKTWKWQFFLFWLWRHFEARGAVCSLPKSHNTFQKRYRSGLLHRFRTHS